MNKRWRLLLALLWILFVLYPNPVMLATTIGRTISPPEDADAVGELARTLPDDPNKIRDLVLTKYVPYDYDWNVYGVPWYFPSTKEVLADRRGDCESQAIFLASVLKAKGIPHQLKMTFDHIWVDFEGKQANEMENDAVAFVQRDGSNFQIKMPEEFNFREYLTIQIDARWRPMPLGRKVLLILGIVAIGLGNSLLALVYDWAGALWSNRAQAKRPVG